MAVKRNPKQIKDLALHPIRSAPNALNCWDNRVLAWQFYLQHATVAMLVRKKMIDDFDSVLIIHPGFVIETIDRDLGIVPQIAADLDDPGGINYSKPLKLAAHLINLFREALLETLVYVAGLHLKLG